MARLLESNEATLSVYDEAAVTATLQHLGRLGYTRRMILATLCRGCSPVSQEKHHRKAFRHTGVAQHPDIRQHALWPAIVGTSSRTNILHQVRSPLSTMRERQTQLRFILSERNEPDLITLGISFL